jgi:hypothetical protein
VRTADRLCSECAWPQRALAFAGYRAALEREDYAPSIDSGSAERIGAFIALGHKPRQRELMMLTIRRTRGALLASTAVLVVLA